MRDTGIAIKVEHVGKTFKLPHEKQSSVKGALIGLVRGGKRTYERQEVLNDISFEVKEGEFFGIVGRNGSGKSTLLKMLAGIYKPTKGHIQVNGKLTPFIELGVGFNPELTGRENVFLNGALLGFNRSEMNAMYNDIVKFAELEKFMDQKLKNYSSGMQVRLAFSIAICAESEILVLDEVLAVGDAAFQRKCYDYFTSLKKAKRTVVLVTHDMGAVRQYCDRAIMIEKGELVKRGTPEVVAQAYHKLFSDELASDSGGHAAGTEDRWGEGGIRALSPSIEVDTNYVTIKTCFRADSDMAAPVFGFTIYSPTGTNILEGNTLRMQQKAKDVHSGEHVELTWAVPNVFSSGKYSVSVACCDATATHFYDWLNNAASFSIYKDGQTAGIVDPELKIVSVDYR